MTTNGIGKRPLPDSWTWTTLGEVADPERNRVNPQDFAELPFIGMDDVESETMRLLGAKSSGEMKSSSEHFWPDDVLYGSLRPYLNKVYRPDFEGLCSAEFIVFRSTPHLKSKYLQYFLNQWSFVAFINKQNTGDRPRVKFRQMEDYPFPLAPLSEQERIVAEIEKQFTRLDQAVASLRRLQGSLARYKASVLKAACEGRLVPQDPTDEPADHLLTRILAERRAQWQAANPGKKYQEPVGVAEDTAVLPDLPEGWAWTNMETLIVDGPTNGLYLPKSKYGEGVPILRIDDYQNGESRSSDELRKVAASTEKIQKYSLRKRDIVINRVNSPSHLGKCLVIEDRNLPSLFESNMMRMALSENIQPDFVEFYLQSGNGRARLISNAKWAVNQASINQGDVKSTPVPLPPLAEQERIVAEVERRLSVVTAIEQTITANLSRAERLRQSILHRAFTGQLV